jgi:hypothetical protein
MTLGHQFLFHKEDDNPLNIEGTILFQVTKCQQTIKYESDHLPLYILY